MNQLGNIEVKTINHLGIIAGIIDEIGIVEMVNEQLGIKSYVDFLTRRIEFKSF